MNRKRAFKQPLLLSIALLILACVILPAPFGKGGAIQTSVPPNPISPTETAPAPIPTTTPTSTPTTAPPDQVLPPTATLFPEEQLHTVTDQTNVIEANIPTVWTDTRTEPWKDKKGRTIGTIFMASTNIEAFLKFQAEGVAISVSRHLPVGYAQLLEDEYASYVKQCKDTYKTRWKLENPTYNGAYFVFGECAKTQNTWLSVFSMVSKQDPGQYIARVVAYDMIPTYGDTFRDMILKFKVFAENLP